MMYDKFDNIKCLYLQNVNNAEMPMNNAFMLFIILIIQISHFNVVISSVI